MSCCSIIQQPQNALSTHKLVKLTASDTVSLINIELDENKQPVAQSFCTGVWVAKDVILTANHCVDGFVAHLNEIHGEGATGGIGLFPIILPMGVEIKYIVQNEVGGVGKLPTNVHTSTAYVLDKNEDLALLQTSGPVPSHEIARLADSTPKIGDKIFFTGHPTGLYYTYEEGFVSAYRNQDADEFGLPIKVYGPFMQISAPIFGGNSGGGVFDQYGKLCGIISFISTAPNTGFTIHLKTIRSLLQGQRLAPVKLDLDTTDPWLK